MRVLVTGMTGMAGSHLAEYLLERGDVEVFGTMRWRSGSRTSTTSPRWGALTRWKASRSPIRSRSSGTRARQGESGRV